MDGCSRRLLIVEDDLATLYALRAMFARRGWTVSLARTVSEALASLDPAPDWIILDLWLSDGDGERILRCLRDAGLRSRVAITSGALDPERTVRLGNLAPDLLMPKPIDFDRLSAICDGIEVGSATEPAVARSSREQGETLGRIAGSFPPPTRWSRSSPFQSA